MITVLCCIVLYLWPPWDKKYHGTLWDHLGGIPCVFFMLGIAKYFVLVMVWLFERFPAEEFVKYL